MMRTPTTIFDLKIRFRNKWKMIFLNSLILYISREPATIFIIEWIIDKIFSLSFIAFISLFLLITSTITPLYHLHVYSSFSLTITFSILSMHLEGCKRKIVGERDVNLEKIRGERDKCYKRWVQVTLGVTSRELHLF